MPSCTIDRDGNGFLDAAELARFFQDLFEGIPAVELRLLVAYVDFMDVDKDGLVRPDELLQFLHAIPMADPNGVTYQPGFPAIPSTTHPQVGPSGTNQYPTTRKLAWQPAAPEPQTAPEFSQAMLHAYAHSGYAGPLDAGHVQAGHGYQQVPMVSPSASYPPPPPVVAQTLPAVQAQTAQVTHTGPSPHAPSPAFIGSPYAMSSPPASPRAVAAPPSPTPPMGAMPYMMAGLPGQPPVVGYILPYEKDLFQQLVAEAVHSPARSPNASRPASPAGSRPPSPPPPAVYPALPAPAAHAGQLQHQQQQQQQPSRYPTINQLPPQEQSADPSGYASGHSLPSPRQRSSYDASSKGWPPPLEEGVEVLDEFANSKRGSSPVPDYQKLDMDYPQQQLQYRQDVGSPDHHQQQEQQQQWAPPYGPVNAQQQLEGKVQHTQWPQSSSLAALGGPYSHARGFPTRQGPFGLMQELERFLISRRAQMLNFFAMAASSAHSLPPSPSGRPSTGGMGARGMAVTRPALVGVVQRAVPSASVHDTRYVQAIVDALLPHQRMISMEVSLLLIHERTSALRCRYLSMSDQPLVLSSLLGLPLYA
ncbi:hypothetical protein DUNSADRAFT_9459 [Dunaliella salina]|uniref:EF-hand domain-containing protein n=1 Tax=Dunaliella salina TaxID=3046 RepID=A0ABQ7GHD7_DUNSA|nr:hypothetical protein DUNSADRAFT_9459 [Dunaliella salina]|eukprot:KAF5834021.1 hypothetical protein DUNSADRAFT_9459 [Dunaliella salina]